MTEEQIFAVVDKFYPAATAIILNDKLGATVAQTSSFHIGIIVVDHLFSAISSFSTVEGKIKIDFLELPLSDIENVLFNESFDQKAALSFLLKGSRIIRGSNIKAIEMIHTKALEYLATDNKANQDPTSRKLAKRLRSIKQKIDKTPVAKICSS